VTSSDIREASSLWSGRISQKKAVVYRSDREHFVIFSNPSALTFYDLKRFIWFANISTAKRATGGYSIKYCFSGPLKAWVPMVRAALLRARGFRTEVAAIRQADLLANSRTTAARKSLGVSAASKLLFFGAPHLPIFIFDRLAGDALGVRGPSSYKSWHRTAMRTFRHTNFDEPALREWQPCDAPKDWFRRRAFDIALIRKR
jgi:hypothetical protein